LEEIPMRSLVLVSFACLTLSASAFQAPVNDNCNSPVVLTAIGVYAFDTTQATTSPGIVNGFCPVRGRDIWFSWTPAQAGIASFFTCNQTTLDTNIAVYSNGPCPVGAPMVCDDDACGNLESLVTWVTQPGVTYYLQLGRSGLSAGGTGTFTLDFLLPPANDDCGSPVNLGSTSGSAYDNTLASTGVQGQGNPGCTDVRKDLWYTWTATQNGTATLDTCGQTGDDTALAVYAGINCPAATSLACDDDGCVSQSSVTWPITAGSVYTLQVGSSTFGNGGPGSFSIVETGSGSTGTLFCPGDGTGAACPCANPSAVGADEGCASSLGVGGALRGTGAASIANDTFVLTATGVPNGPGLFFQGTAQMAGGAGVPFGDGLLCVTGAIVRLGVVFASANTSSFPSGVLPPVSVAGGAASGNTFHYQLWYRDAVVAFCPSAVFNLTNALSLTWAP
jgi:hypothetical protein